MFRLLKLEFMVNLFSDIIELNWAVLLDVIAATLELCLTLTMVALGMAVATVLVP
ncbi:MAG TPA: hypothetical protein VMF86_00655 [Stellaceae bacterium]|nr:hypothetical protein [Stellaceae bacterium]